MSDSSNSSADSEAIAARLRLMSPQGRWKIFEEAPGATEGLDAFCVVAKSHRHEIAGFDLCCEKQHRVSEKLGEVVARLLRDKGLPRWFGVLCAPEGVVGSRPCRTVVPGVRDYYYLRSGMTGTASSATDRARDLACSVLGLGHLPLVGATTASLATCLVAFALSALPVDVWRLTMLVLASVASLFCLILEKWARRHYLAGDPREVVLDEVAGMAIALAITGPGTWTILAAFVAFRFFDIFKPGIHWIEERHWPGTILWDDLLAGLYAGVAVFLFSIGLR